MKRSTFAKLTVRRETLRALSNIELARVVGGDDAVLAETGKELCTAAARQSGAAMCPALAPA